MQKYQDSVINGRGRPVSGAAVAVTTLAGSAATLYSDNGITQITTQITTNPDGFFSFYAADGRYTVTISGAGISTATRADILLEDPADGSAALANATDPAKGSALVGHYDPVAPAYLKTVSDIINMEPISVLRNIDRAKHASILARTNTDDLSTGINDLVDAMVTAKRGNIVFSAGLIHAQNIKLRSNIKYSGHGFHSTLKLHASATAANLLGEATPPTAHSKIIVCDLELDGNRANVAFPADDGYGNVIRLNQVSFSQFRNIRIRDSVFNAVSVYNESNDNHFDLFDIADVGKAGALPPVYTFNGFFFEAGSSRNKVVAPRINVTRQYGIWIGARDSDNFDNEIICPWIASTTGDGIRIGDEATANVCYRPKVISPTVLSAGDVGIRVYHAGTGSVQDAEVTGGLIQGCTNMGVLDDTKATNSRYTGVRIKDCGTYGITTAGTGARVVGVMATGAGTLDVRDVGTNTQIVASLPSEGRQGSFTPTVLTGGAAVGRTYASQQGSYRINGNRVEGNISIVLSAVGSSTGALTIGGLPYTSKTSGAFGSPKINVANLTYTGMPFGLILNASTSITLFVQASGVGSSALSDAALAANSEFYITFSYEI